MSVRVTLWLAVPRVCHKYVPYIGPFETLIPIRKCSLMLGEGRYQVHSASGPPTLFPSSQDCSSLFFRLARVTDAPHTKATPHNYHLLSPSLYIKNRPSGEKYSINRHKQPRRAGLLPPV